MSLNCRRCVVEDASVEVRESELWIPVCLGCLRNGDLVNLEAPAGDAVGEVGGVNA